MALLTPIGTLFKVAADGSAPDTVAEVTSIDGPSSSVEALDPTSLTSSVVTRIAGRTDWGTITVNLNLSASNAEELDTLGGTDVDWQIVIPDASATSITLSGGGVMSQVNISVQGGSVVSASISIQVSGDVSITEA